MHFPFRSQRVDHPAERVDAIDRRLSDHSISTSKRTKGGDVRFHYFFFFATKYDLFISKLINTRGNKEKVNYSSKYNRFLVSLLSCKLERFNASTAACTRGRDKGCERK